MSAAVGLLACLLSSLTFGSMFVPVHRHDGGNGIFVQWCMSISILCVGMGVNHWQHYARFQPLAMLGGALWAIGNATAVPCINEIGMGLTFLICGVTSCVTGWAASRFGLFGIHQEIPSSPFLNYLGLSFVLVGAVLVSLLSGVFYGVTFVPVIYMQDHREQFPDAKAEGLPYVFAYYSGIFATATAILVGYIVYSGSRPEINPRITGPSLLSGFMFAVAQTSWFVANDALSQAVTYPIINMVPGVCATLWSVLYFKDIQGRRNLRILTIAIGITLSGALLVGLSI